MADETHPLIHITFRTATVNKQKFVISSIVLKTSRNNVLMLRAHNLMRNDTRLTA
jgi:hypothetical protein